METFIIAFLFILSLISSKPSNASSVVNLFFWVCWRVITIWCIADFSSYKSWSSTASFLPVLASGHRSCYFSRQMYKSTLSNAAWCAFATTSLVFKENKRTTDNQTNPVCDLLGKLLNELFGAWKGKNLRASFLPPVSLPFILLSFLSTSFFISLWREFHSTKLVLCHSSSDYIVAYDFS